MDPMGPVILHNFRLTTRDTAKSWMAKRRMRPRDTSVRGRILPTDEELIFYGTLLPWEPTTFIFRGYNPYIGGVKPSFFIFLRRFNPRNLQRSDPRVTDPEKTWVSHSSIATYWTGSVGIRSHSIFDGFKYDPYMDPMGLWPKNDWNLATKMSETHIIANKQNDWISHHITNKGLDNMIYLLICIYIIILIYKNPVSSSWRSFGVWASNEAEQKHAQSVSQWPKDWVPARPGNYCSLSHDDVCLLNNISVKFHL